jgi:polysaccharide pyruvyl transferase WcaK-like protein
MAYGQSKSKRMRISFFGHFGSPNTGNESTLLAILSRLRYLSPDCEFCCICTNPKSVVARDGIEAVPINSRVVRTRNREGRLHRHLRRAFVGGSEELWQYVRAFRTLKGTDMLIIPGTGLLTDAYGLFGWGPYNLLKWSLMAKLRGCRVIFVSVGAGPIYGALGRFLVKSALSLADYRSYRDDSSLKYLKDIGFRTKHDKVYPDLVFSLPEALMPPDEKRMGRKRVVGLGLMLHAGKYSVVNPSRDTYVAYLESLVVFVKWLRARLETYDEERVTYRPITSVQEILSQLAATDIVVGTRFHNVLLALLLNKPVIAISFHHKCASLMSQMGLSEYCQDINAMNADTLITQFQELERNSEKVRRVIRQGVEKSRRALDEQYDLLFRNL